MMHFTQRDCYNASSPQASLCVNRLVHSCVCKGIKLLIITKRQHCNVLCQGNTCLCAAYLSTAYICIRNFFLRDCYNASLPHASLYVNRLVHSCVCKGIKLLIITKRQNCSSFMLG